MMVAQVCLTGVSIDCEGSCIGEGSCVGDVPDVDNYLSSCRHFFVQWKGPDTLQEVESLNGYHFASRLYPAKSSTTAADPGKSDDDDSSEKESKKDEKAGTDGNGDNNDGGDDDQDDTGEGEDEDVQQGKLEQEPLPAPAVVGMQPGFLGQFFFVGTKMQHMPNTATTIPDVSYVTAGIDLTSKVICMLVCCCEMREILRMSLVQ